MNARVRDNSDPSQGKQLWRRELLGYVSGVIAALFLTLVPFAIVHWRIMVPRSVYYLIGAFALVQMIVHFRFFLHIGLRQKREDLELILFSAVLLVLMVGGTIWVMWNLAARMMVMPGCHERRHAICFARSARNFSSPTLSFRGHRQLHRRWNPESSSRVPTHAKLDSGFCPQTTRTAPE